ncbi:MAG: acetolactate synthase large subunit [Burkholderiales bacterium]
MNSAEALARTLLACGVDTIFANPGTSEMHFVAALDRVPGLRCVLGLAETVVAGSADGYGRLAGRPAATLMHCGPGLGNGIASLHNARRGFTPIVNIVGDQATYHRPLDAPLTADTEGLARAVSQWVRTSTRAANVAADAAAAVQAANAPPGNVATLILPADCAWDEGAEVAAPLPPVARASVTRDAVANAARALKSGESAMILLAGAGLSEAGLRAAQRIAAATGAQLRAPTQVSRLARGRGRVPLDRLPYAVDLAVKVLAPVRHLVLAGGRVPVGFFAYPGKPGVLTPPGCQTYVLARIEEDIVGALEALADELGARKDAVIPEVAKPEPCSGRFEPVAFGRTLAALLPEQAIVMEDAVTSGRAIFPPTFGAAPHDWSHVTGGAIGFAFSAATGAAVASPDRKVVALQADGGGMYCLQALWTQAREKLDVVNVVFANRRYAILQGELAAVGAQPGPASKALFSLADPELQWTQLAQGMGVEAARVDTLEAFADVFRAACARRGPFLIELLIA